MTSQSKESQEPPFWVQLVTLILVAGIAYLFTATVFGPVVEEALARIPTISKVREVVEAKGYTDVEVSEPDRANAHKYCQESELYYQVWARTPEAKGIDLYVCTDGEQYWISFP